MQPLKWKAGLCLTPCSLHVYYMWDDLEGIDGTRSPSSISKKVETHENTRYYLIVDSLTISRVTFNFLELQTGPSQSLGNSVFFRNVSLWRVPHLSTLCKWLKFTEFTLYPLTGLKENGLSTNVEFKEPFGVQLQCQKLLGDNVWIDRKKPERFRSSCMPISLAMVVLSYVLNISWVLLSCTRAMKYIWAMVMSCLPVSLRPYFPDYFD